MISESLTEFVILFHYLWSTESGQNDRSRWMSAYIWQNKYADYAVSGYMVTYF